MVVARKRVEVPGEAAEPADESAIVTRTVSLVSPRGAFGGFLALPSLPSKAAWKSAVVVIGQHPEVDLQVVQVARRLADAGHGALAIGQRALALRSPASLDVTLDVDAALAYVRTEASGRAPRFAVVGYGPGGFTALVAGYRSQVGAAIAFYGEGPKRLHAELAQILDRPKRHAAALLFLLGGDDEAVQPTAVAAIRERLQRFGMQHSFIIYPRMNDGFAHPGHGAYRALEANESWGRLLVALEGARRLRNRTPPRRAPRASS